MRTHRLPAVLMAFVLAAAVTACGGSSSHGGTTTATGSAGGQDFQAQITSLGAALDRVSSISGSTSDSRAAADLGRARQGLTTVRDRLRSRTFPAVVQPQKQQLLSALARWNTELATAQQKARQGESRRGSQAPVRPSIRT